MVASLHDIVPADRISPKGIHGMLLNHGDPSAPSSPLSVIRSNDLGKIHAGSRKERTSPSANTARESFRTEVQQRTFSPTRPNNLRRHNSDDLDQSKHDDPDSRRSIFGRYFKEQARSSSDPQLERSQPTRQPHKTPTPINGQPIKRSLSGLSKYNTSERNTDLCDDNRSHRNLGHNLNLTHEGPPVDYRVFAPSEQQAEESAICSRYRELNKEHEKDYDSVLERQVQIERSLPPFPSPLIRFCSETTVTVAGPDLYSSVRRRHSDNRKASPRHHGERHYSGVYSLLMPSSVLRPSTYDNSNKTAITAIKVPSKASTPTNDSHGNMSTKTEAEVEVEDLNHHQDHSSALLSSSFNLSRSYIENPALLKNLPGIEGSEEKKENDSALMYSSSKTTILMTNDKTRKGISSSIAPTLLSTSDGVEEKDSHDNDSRDGTERSQAVLLPQDRHLRFDPRVTVTEFEDPVPRKWYVDIELEQHKREAIALAQAYLRKYPAVLQRYRQPILDPITKTTRKRALFSLPVFSSTYSGTGSDSREGIRGDAGEASEETSENRSSVGSPSSSSAPQQTRRPIPSVKKILIVHPNPVLSSLFCKSMISMFPSAELVTARSFDEASRLIRQSFASSNKVLSLFSTVTECFDIIIIERRLTKDGSIENTLLNSIFKSFDKGPMGILNVCMKSQVESSPEDTVMPLTTSVGMHHGCDLIQQVCELSSHKQQKRSLLIGLSFRPEDDTMVMMKAGADIVWGLPIPKVGKDLRNQLLAKLRAKRYPTSSNSNGEYIRE
mmetsp:Transcript_16171/g.37483  ORF Transcript_16171/g.37483 Transcript_16171/m.37483 type:complete len:781 (+) Transcript_16171:436-2778(+)|eukprot:CAMPEP_0197179350 /NCGR_PEP_ID=MMETSP1423-20130617/4334_1 /TAXON_ID=476441 /ORGANISM="Pseudo-nitzschia heimii, Strain UNC1101" /LENGTH=780 /DNA_ID=CAMNT_0042629253 /DNA_START=404 /DNA_END=2746 /DNA_ORIENTATION=+